MASYPSDKGGGGCRRQRSGWSKPNNKGKQGNADSERSGPAGNSLERLSGPPRCGGCGADCGRRLWGTPSATGVMIGGRGKER